MISRIMDWIDRKVNPEAYDPLSIKNNHYNQWGSPAEEQPAAISLTNQANAIYQQGLTQSYGNAVTTGNWSNVAYPNTGGLGSGILLPGTSNNNVTLPPKSGMVFTMRFVDEVGVPHDLFIDQAYMGIFQHITLPSYIPQPIQTKMLEGDFSLDEMEAAENLIAELSSGRNQGNEQGQDTGCAT